MKNRIGTLQVCPTSLFRINNSMSCQIAVLLMNLFIVESLGEMSTCLYTSLSGYPPQESRKHVCQLQIEKWKQQKLGGAAYAVKWGPWLNSRKCNVKARCDLFLPIQKLFLFNCSVANANREWGAGGLLCWWLLTGFCSQTLGPHA